SVSIFDTLFSVCSFVFGVGYVVLPMIERDIVPLRLMSPDAFFAGYGMTQAVPGPMFTFSRYLGNMLQGIAGAVVATIGIFLPSFLFIVAALPFLSELRKRITFQGFLMGVN